MIDQSDAAAAVETILGRNLLAYRRTLDIQHTGDTYQINEVLADGSLKPLADTPYEEEALCLASSAKDIVALCGTIAALSLKLDVEDPPRPSIDALAVAVRSPQLRTNWRLVDWQATDPPFDDVTSDYTPALHRKVMAEWRRTGQAPAGYEQCALPDQGTLPRSDWGYLLDEVDWSGFDNPAHGA